MLFTFSPFCSPLYTNRLKVVELCLHLRHYNPVMCIIKATSNKMSLLKLQSAQNVISLALLKSLNFKSSCQVLEIVNS